VSSPGIGPLNAHKVVLAEWKPSEKLCLYELPNMKDSVPATIIFGKVPKTAKVPTLTKVES
jgi:hypothetical protein